MLRFVAGVISVRFTKEERQQMREAMVAAGFPTLSAYIRVKLGLDASGGLEPTGGYEEMEASTLLKSHVELRDRMDTLTAVARGIARAVGAKTDAIDKPREYPKRREPELLPDENGNVDIPNAYQEQLIGRATIMPAGFER